uniref:hypothetical protein n=1 Tax=Bacillaceae bacterium JMAK1 TaxID=1028381 RepID=UPI0003ABE8BC|nr:hypothetical protein [Bacillaceae bacterium JMAK1]AGQ45466.1 hypothetical protein [Bacillaceae bacterium JMAK1]
MNMKSRWVAFYEDTVQMLDHEGFDYREDNDGVILVQGDVHVITVFIAQDINDDPKPVAECSTVHERTGKDANYKDLRTIKGIQNFIERFQ